MEYGAAKLDQTDHRLRENEHVGIYCCHNLMSMLHKHKLTLEQVMLANWGRGFGLKLMDEP